MRTIRVTGRGKIQVHPDTTRLTIELEGTYKEYAETVSWSSQKTEELKELLAPFGFERKDLKTLSFRVEPEYESYKEKSVQKWRLIGYQFHHTMKVEFDSDNHRLGKVLYALAHCSLKPEIRISYTVKDPEAVRNELLGKAVKDSMTKAGVLSAAAGLSLGNIQSIDYSWGEVNLEYRPMQSAVSFQENLPYMAMSKCSYDLDIEPDDIDVEDIVTVVWEIR